MKYLSVVSQEISSILSQNDGVPSTHEVGLIRGRDET